MIGLLRIYIIISVAPSLKSWTRKPHRVHSLLPLLLFLVPHKSVLWPCHDLSLRIQSQGILFASLFLSFLICYCAFLWESATFSLGPSNLPFSLFKMTKLCGRKSRNHTDNVPPQCCSADPSQFQCLSLASHLQFQPVTALLKSRNSF